MITVVCEGAVCKSISLRKTLNCSKHLMYAQKGALQLKRNHLMRLVFFTQGTGAAFFAVFLASYALALPSNQVLHGQPIFRIPLSTFGALFLVLTAISLVLSIIIKPEE